MVRIVNVSFGLMLSMEPSTIPHRLPRCLFLTRVGRVGVGKYKVVDKLDNTILLPFSFSSPFHLL
jgi:hypothetical protein